MEYKIVTSQFASGLNSHITAMLNEGWKPKGSHQIRIDKDYNRVSGGVILERITTFEYSQTMIKK